MMFSEYGNLEMFAVMLCNRRMNQGAGQSSSLDLLWLVR